MFGKLGCEWNRNSRTSTDLLDKKYNVCPGSHHVRYGEMSRSIDFTITVIRAWNGSPAPERRWAEQSGSGMSVGRRKVDGLEDHPTDLKK